MRKPEPSRFIVLSPYDPREAFSLKGAAARAGMSVGTIKNWCLDRGIGRRVGGGTWRVSKVALEMVLEDDDTALLAYHRQAWDDPVVKMYFDRIGVPFERTAIPAMFAKLTRLAG